MAILIYGVTGYAGALVSRTAAAYRMPHIVAGRSPEGVRKCSEWTGLEGRSFELGDPAEIARWLSGVRVVVNCAAPFKVTAEPLARACMLVGAHYLDLSSEVSEHLALKSLEAAAAQAGTMLMPGVGSSIMAGDCLAKLVSEQIPKPSELTMAFDEVGNTSKGALRTLLRGIHEPGMVRRHGSLEPCYAGTEERSFTIAGKKVNTVNNPWRAELLSCFRSTGIRDIKTFSSFSRTARFLMKHTNITESKTMQSYVDRAIRKAPFGPSDKELYKASTRIYAHVKNKAGQEAALTLVGPGVFRLTGLSAIACAYATLDAQKPAAGYQTPARAFGAELITRIEGVQITS